MTTPSGEQHFAPTLTIEASPNPVDAGAELAVRLRVWCDDGGGLAGRGILIRDEADREVAHAELHEAGEIDDHDYAGEAAFAAPTEVGRWIYAAVLPSYMGNGVSYAAVAVPLAFDVRAHEAHVSVWGVPTAIPAGEPFTFKLGIKCSCGCNLGGRPFTVVDQAGVEVAGRLGQSLWPGTRAVYFAEVEGRAPPTPGPYDWEARSSALTMAGMPHAAGVANVSLTVVDQPELEITIEAFDREKQAPIKGIHVLLHPYRAYTDENGVARVRVAKGRYKLVVSGFKYIPYENLIDATGDVTERAELEVERAGDGYFVP